MATQKKPTRYLSGKVEVKATFAQLRDKNQSRGPGQIGQQRDMATVRLGRISQPQLAVRLAAVKSILETGKIPAAVKGGAAKGIQAAEKKVVELSVELEAANARILELEAEFEKAPSVDPVVDAPDETPTPDPDPEPAAED